MIDKNHPYRFLTSLLKNQDTVFSLSKYIYAPDSLFDDRHLFSVNAREFSEARVIEEIDSLNRDQELALHSKVTIKGRTWHIPMIDFSIEETLPRRVFDRMSSFLPKSIMLNMAFYTSGRSYHAYSTTLLSPKDWLDFMGRLLLINQHGQAAIVDSRWVGHRLIGGFASLRWSNNSGKYRGMPTKIPFP